MIDREKVITGLECCSVKQSCSGCPWTGIGCNDRLHLAALELLKEQKQKFFVDSEGKITPLNGQKHGHWVSVPDKSPKTTTINMHSFIYSCSKCGKAVGHHAEYNYCPGCGAIMTWMVNQDG